MKKLIVIALIMAIITGVSVYYFATNLEDRFNVQKVPVAVAINMIPKNTALKSEMIIIKQLPPEAVNTLSVKSFEEIKGLITKEDIQPNEQILTTSLSSVDKNGNTLSYKLKMDYRALTIKTDEITGVAGNINKGDKIDIVAILPDKASEKGIITKMIAENLEVMEVGLKGGTGEENMQYSSITISVPVNDALRISYALSEGKYRILLRSVLDENKVISPDYIP